MRLWSVHPRYLDRVGLLAVWRESLLAKAVLEGRTKGYRLHPQLERFRAQSNPLKAIDTYLLGILEESKRRGYCFDASKVGIQMEQRMDVTEGQLRFERAHLLKKLLIRDKTMHKALSSVTVPDSHPLFTIKAGPVEPWERSGR